MFDNILFGLFLTINILTIKYFLNRFILKIKKLVFIPIIIFGAIFSITAHLPYLIFITIICIIGWFQLYIKLSNLLLSIFFIFCEAFIVMFNFFIVFQLIRSLNSNVVNLYIYEIILLVFQLIILSKINSHYQVFDSILVYTQKNNSLALIISSICIGLFFINYHISYTIGTHLVIYTTFLMLLVFSTMLIILFIVSYNNYKEYELEQYRKISQDHDTYYIELDKFKHDYKSLILSLYASIEEKNFNEAKSLITNLAEYSYNQLPDGKLNNVKNPEIKGVLLEAISRAKLNGITINVDFSEPIYINNTPIFAIVRLISIIINNAIEEVSTHMTDKQNIWFSVRKGAENRIEITCKNNITNANNQKVSDLLQEKYTSKKNHSGLGLSNFLEIVNSSKHIDYDIYADYNEKIFTAAIIINNSINK
ncbi:GHKL domain-containing protein [Enterococcus faecium]|uniref:GHKL domain-containing protein n=1 Tax=Enterococcus faecium TaxID=1352 RepID=UPI000BF006B3|nr:GHKL domain-containing protein [Enterococcus faecium]PEH49549.1 hypothetical protein CRM75_01980 [Enterococcus faecium]